MGKEVRCKGAGAYRYTWPGKDETVVCQKHAPGIKAVADAIGLHLQMVPLSENDRALGLVCTSFDSETK